MLDKIFGFCKKTKCLTEVYSKEQVDQIIASLNIGIEDESITTSKLAAGAVTGSKIANAAVSNEKILDKTISNGKIADGAITTSKIAGDAVTGSKIASKTITNSHIADEAITGEKIRLGQIFAFHLREDAVYKAGNYNGLEYGSSWLLELGFKPKFVIVYGSNSNLTAIITQIGDLTYGTAYWTNDSGSFKVTSLISTIEDTGLLIADSLLDKEGETYSYIAFR